MRPRADGGAAFVPGPPFVGATRRGEGRAARGPAPARSLARSLACRPRSLQEFVGSTLAPPWSRSRAAGPGTGRAARKEESARTGAGRVEGRAGAAWAELARGPGPPACACRGRSHGRNPGRLGPEASRSRVVGKCRREGAMRALRLVFVVRPCYQLSGWGADERRGGRFRSLSCPWLQGSRSGRVEIVGQPRLSVLPR